MIQVLFAAAAVVVAAPVSNVTVFSDRARVVRTAEISPSGNEKLELPLLPDSVESDSIRVEGAGALEVKRIDIEHIDGDDFPRDRARALLDQLEKADDEIARARAELNEVSAARSLLERLSPQVPPTEALKPAPHLNAGAWQSVLSWIDGWEERLHARERTGAEKLRTLGIAREKIAEEARTVGGARRRSGWRVRPTVGGGKGTLTLSYLVGSARWYPSYDLALDAEKGEVLLAFAGRVSQESGEDWDDAKLVLSTAEPATSVIFPRLATWKIGEKERFVPTPHPQLERMSPPPRSVPLPPRDEIDDETLRNQLVALVGSPPQGDVSGIAGGMVGGARGGGRGPMGHKYNYEPKPSATPAPPPPPMESPPAAMDEKEEENYKTADADMPSAPAPVSVMSAEVSVLRSSPGSYRRPAPPPDAVGGLSPPPAWRPPSFAGDLPISLAGGYDLAFPSVAKESIASGGGARRVALLAERWPVKVERRLFPALAPDAFLVAELKNPSQRVLPGGHADLSVGADPAGTATMKVVAPGEKFTLPLGLDRAIKPIRNVKVVTAEKGVFSKDEIGEYTVTTEIANPYRTALSVRVVDQVPVTNDKNVEIKLLSATPAPSAQSANDKVLGKIEWMLSIPPSGKSTVTFVYSLKRPKNWRLHQN